VWQSLCRRRARLPRLLCGSGQRHLFQSAKHPPRRAGGLILYGLRQRLMAPELVEEFVRAFQQEINL
jgi:hypothetical protein